MKNLLIFINPKKRFHDDRFGEESSILAKIQIDNSLELGWKRENIILVTNFDYEYNGVKALIVGDENYCLHFPQASKINTIVSLFERGIIEKGELYWLHDFDAFQLETIKESELGLEMVDMGLTDYGLMPRWNMGSVFFKESSRDIFNWIKEGLYKNNTDEERALVMLTSSNVNNINERIKKVNLTYNFTGANMYWRCYKQVTKPIKVAHFHPFGTRQFGVDFKALDFFMHGVNKTNKPFITPSLIRIFKRNGIT